MLPWFEFYVVPIQTVEFIQTTYKYFLSGNSYLNECLSSPYVDGCINYTSLGFLDRNDAINTCIANAKILTYNQTYDRKIYQSGINYSTTIVDENRDNCTKKYHNTDCYANNVFTHMTYFSHIDPDESICQVNMNFFIISSQT